MPIQWAQDVIKENEILRYLDQGQDFISAMAIERLLAETPVPSPDQVRAILAKAMEIQTLEPRETAALMAVEDPGVWDEIYQAAARIKRKVYDNRVVTFAPLYVSSQCVNNCAYCGFRGENAVIQRRTLGMDEIRREAEVLAGTIGHKRIILVCGEHPATGPEYLAEAMRTIYSVRVKTRRGYGAIRRINVNAAPLGIEDYARIRAAGIGTYQVFQETYHPETYHRVHPARTLKGNYHWRLYSTHRAMEAGIDDVAIGVLFGLYDWRYEVLGLLGHARDLEKRFGIGPHTVSFPRLEPAANTPFVRETGHRVSDDDFKKLVAVLRLSIPYAGMIVTCRETKEMIREVIPMCTQRDASSQVGIGAYSERYGEQEASIQQFLLGDSRSMDAVVQELAAMGYITSFCTAGYRCGRTGDHIMSMLRSGREGCFCKLNAVLTFQEWLDDFASEETRKVGEAIIRKEIAEIQARVPRDFALNVFRNFSEYHQRIKQGERDLCF